MQSVWTVYCFFPSTHIEVSQCLVLGPTVYAMMLLGPLGFCALHRIRAHYVSCRRHWTSCHVACAAGVFELLVYPWHHQVIDGNVAIMEAKEELNYPIQCTAYSPQPALHSTGSRRSHRSSREVVGSLRKSQSPGSMASTARLFITTALHLELKERMCLPGFRVAPTRQWRTHVPERSWNSKEGATRVSHLERLSAKFLPTVLHGHHSSFSFSSWFPSSAFLQLLFWAETE